MFGLIYIYFFFNSFMRCWFVLSGCMYEFLCLFTYILVCILLYVNGLYSEVLYQVILVIIRTFMLVYLNFSLCEWIYYMIRVVWGLGLICVLYWSFRSLHEYYVDVFVFCVTWNVTSVWYFFFLVVVVCLFSEVSVYAYCF